MPPSAGSHFGVVWRSFGLCFYWELVNLFSLNFVNLILVLITLTVSTLVKLFDKLFYSAVGHLGVYWDSFWAVFLFVSVCLFVTDCLFVCLSFIFVSLVFLINLFMNHFGKTLDSHYINTFFTTCFSLLETILGYFGPILMYVLLFCDNQSLFSSWNLSDFCHYSGSQNIKKICDMFFLFFGMSWGMFGPFWVYFFVCWETQYFLTFLVLLWRSLNKK